MVEVIIIKRNPVELLTNEEFQRLLDISNSFKDLARRLGLEDSSYSHIRVGKRVKNGNFDLTKFNLNKKNNLKINKKNRELKDILVINSDYPTHKLKNKLLKENILRNVCSICNLKGTWNGKPLNMVLDHINGVNNDNRLENLRIVCYNCNSQLDTFAGRNVKKK